MSLMRVLVVEDSDRLQRLISGALRKSGYAVDVAGDGEEGLWMAENGEYDVIVLDIMLPKLDGLSVLAELRRKGKPTHLLLLTARDAVADRIRGLQAGADDYLVKPFDLEELLARVQALCRRKYGDKQNRLKIGELVIDLSIRLARVQDEILELTAREYSVLEYLAHRRGVVVTRTEIEEHVYDSADDLMSNVVDSAICSLRRKISAVTSAPLIHTRRGMGYVLGTGDEFADVA